MNRDRWVRRAQEASDAFGLVLVLVIGTYVLASLLDNEGWPAVVEMAAGTATGVLALISSRAPAPVRHAALALGVLALCLGALGALTGGRGWLTAGALIEVTLLAAAAVAVLTRVVTEDQVSTRTILGAISVYAILGLIFTFVYATVERVDGDPFFGTLPNAQSSDFIFFSFTTLTTTGYGDLVPAAQPGRMLAGLEMLFGQIFLVTLVARLVSLWRPRRARREAQPASSDSSSAS